jgi:hypothetical protein
MCAPTLRTHRSRASTARGPGWPRRSGTPPERSPTLCRTARASDLRPAMPAARRRHCSDRSDRRLTSTPRGRDRWPLAPLAAHAAWSVFVVLVWGCNARGSPESQPRINNIAFKRTPEGDLRSKVLRRERRAESVTRRPLPTSYRGISSLFASRLWNTTTIKRNAPRMKFSQKELSWNVP